jgi:D-3-phosphoglycerate dehydrogenase
MNRILIADKLAPEGLEVFKGAADVAIDVKVGLKPDELVRTIPGYQGLVVRSASQVTAAVIEAGRDLKVVGRAGIGVDNVDLEAASKHGVLVMNTPLGNATAAAEHTIALLFAASRKIPQATASMKAGKWEKSKFMGRELFGKTLGIVGLGNIGRIVADRARGLKMKVVAYDPFLSKEAAARLEVTPVTLDELWARADYFTFHTPLTDDTRNLVRQETIAKMKDGVVIVNCARGGIVNEGDLAEALKSGKVAAAALDVFEQEPPGASPLFELPNFICTPHLGASTDEAQVAVSVGIAEQIVAYLNDGVIAGAVNVPSLSREVLNALGAYLPLARKLGSLAGQLTRGAASRLNIEYDGEIAERATTPLTNTVVEGYLSTHLEGEHVNFVNAPILARERGLEVIEAKSARAKDYASQITLRVRKDGADTLLVQGTLFGKNEPRLTRINEYRFEAVPEGPILIVHNDDKPGVIGAVGTLLGARGINISRMQLGLVKERAAAVALWSIDAPAGDAVLSEMRALPNVISVTQVVL